MPVGDPPGPYGVHGNGRAPRVKDSEIIAQTLHFAKGNHEGPYMGLRPDLPLLG